MDTTTTHPAIEHLQAVGFGEYEAKAYATLVQRGPLTGYQLAKSSGIPRPNIYAIIDRLEKRGAVTRVEVGDGVKYAALPAAEMLAQLSRSVESHLSGAQAALGDLDHAPESQYAWNLEGYENTLARAETIIKGARERLLIGLWSKESAHLTDVLADAQARGVRVVTLCIEGCRNECGGCRGDIYRYAVAAESPTRWLMLVADDRELLTAQIAEDGQAKAVQTKLDIFVAMTSQYLRNTIAAAEIVRSLGPRLPKLLDRDAARVLQSDGLAAYGDSWMKRLSAVVRRVRD